MAGPDHSRNRTIDIARGIAILAIIVGHFGIFTVNRVVYTFHVPIFYVITGYFMKRYPLPAFIRRKARTLLVPYLVTCVIVILLSAAITAFSSGNVLSDIAKWTKASLYGAGSAYKIPVEPIGAIWFLLASFWGGLFLQISLRWNKYLRILWDVSLFLLGWFTSRQFFWFPLSIQAGCCATLFMYVGYCVKHISQRKKMVTGIVAFVLWISFILTFRSFYLVRNDFGMGLLDIVRSFAGCYCVLLISEGAEKITDEGSKILSWMGRNSIIILCVHLVEMNLVDWWQVVDKLAEIGIPHPVGEAAAVGIKLIVIFGFSVLLLMSKTGRKLFGIKN